MVTPIPEKGILPIFEIEHFCVYTVWVHATVLAALSAKP